jgi:hypothetical protein
MSDTGVTRKPVLHHVKSLTVRGTVKVLNNVTFPNLTYLELSNDYLFIEDLPHQVETLKISDGTQIKFHGNLDLAKILGNVRVFEGVESTIDWVTDGSFSLPRATSLRMEDLDIHWLTKGFVCFGFLTCTGCRWVTKQSVVLNRISLDRYAS